MITSEINSTADRVIRASDEYRARRAGSSQPDGYWQHGVWLPSAAETRPCCRFHIPTRQPRSLTTYPDSARRHCLGIEHVARLFGVPAETLRQALRRS